MNIPEKKEKHYLAGIEPLQGAEHNVDPTQYRPHSICTW